MAHRRPDIFVHNPPKHLTINIRCQEQLVVRLPKGVYSSELTGSPEAWTEPTARPSGAPLCISFFYEQRFRYPNTSVVVHCALRQNSAMPVGRIRACRWYSRTQLDSRLSARQYLHEPRRPYTKPSFSSCFPSRLLFALSIP